jgi:hypothetical protein
MFNIALTVLAAVAVFLARSMPKVLLLRLRMLSGLA